MPKTGSGDDKELIFFAILFTLNIFVTSFAMSQINVFMSDGFD